MFTGELDFLFCKVRLLSIKKTHTKNGIIFSLLFCRSHLHVMGMKPWSGVYNAIIFSMFFPLQCYSVIIFMSMMSSRSSSVLPFTWRSMIHPELTFVNGVR